MLSEVLLKEKDLQPWLLYLAKISFKIDGEIKSFMNNSEIKRIQISLATNTTGTYIASKHKRKERPTVSSVQLLSHVWLFATPWIAAHQASLSITNSRSSPKFMSIESVMPSSHLMLCRPLLLLPPIPPSIRVFSNESTLHMRWPKYWSFSFSISPSNEHLGLIFRMDWLDLLAVQGTLKNLLHTTVQKHQFFGAQPSSQSNSHIHTWLLDKS